MQYAFSWRRYGDGRDSVDWEAGVCGERAFGARAGAGCGPGVECGLRADGVAAAGVGVMYGNRFGDHSGEEAGETEGARGDLFGGTGERAATSVDEDGASVPGERGGYRRCGEEGDCVERREILFGVGDAGEDGGD